MASPGVNSPLRANLYWMSLQTSNSTVFSRCRAPSPLVNRLYGMALQFNASKADYIFELNREFRSPFPIYSDSFGVRACEHSSFCFAWLQLRARRRPRP